MLERVREMLLLSTAHAFDGIECGSLLYSYTSRVHTSLLIGLLIAYLWHIDICICEAQIKALFTSMDLLPLPPNTQMLCASARSIGACIMLVATVKIRISSLFFSYHSQKLHWWKMVFCFLGYPAYSVKKLYFF